MLKSAFFLLALIASLASNSLPAEAAQTIPLEDFSALGIKAQAVKLVDPRFKSLADAEDRYYLEVKLGRLSEEQFRSMKALYGDASRVPYVAGKEYDLVDFLHPAAQATVNQVFGYNSHDTSGLSEIEEAAVSEEDYATILPLVKNGVDSFSNCWNTTMQILRLQHFSTNPSEMRYQLYWPGRWRANDELTSEELSTALLPEQAKAGDALLISDFGEQARSANEKGMIQHTAIVLSESLVFEKTDSSEDDPYRISFKNDVLSKYKRILGKGFQLSYRRFNGSDKKTFPPATSYRLIDYLSPRAYEMVKKLAPAIAEINLVSDCETGLGGGCDIVTSELLEFKVITNPKTGRGIFYGPKKALDRFFPLKGR